MSHFYHIIIYNPLLNALIFLISVLPGHNLGMAIIILTIIIRLIFSPLYHKSIMAQEAMKQIQPKIKEIQKKYKNNRKQQGEKLMELYRQYKINPFSSFLYMLIQLPVLIALYQILIHLNVGSGVGIYSFIHYPLTMTTIFLGFINLNQKSILIGLLAGFFQFCQGKIMEARQNHKSDAEAFNKYSKKEPQQVMMNFTRQMNYIMPLITFLIAWRLPAGVGLFWTTMTLFSVFQELWINRQLKLNSKLVQPSMEMTDKK